MKACILCLLVPLVALAQGKDFFSFSMKDVLEEEDISFEKYKGKVTLVTNVASECGFTDSHYKAYKQLYDTLSTWGRFTILAFPCNQFDNQEPLRGKRLKQFVSEKYQGKYELFQLTNVVDSGVPEVWQYVISESGQAPTWNFWKYLVDHEGQVLRAWGPNIAVEDIYDEIKAAVDAAEAALGRIEPVFVPDDPITEIPEHMKEEHPRRDHGGEL